MHLSVRRNSVRLNIGIHVISQLDFNYLSYPVLESTSVQSFIMERNEKYRRMKCVIAEKYIVVQSSFIHEEKRANLRC